MTIRSSLLYRLNEVTCGGVIRDWHKILQLYTGTLLHRLWYFNPCIGEVFSHECSYSGCGFCQQKVKIKFKRITSSLKWDNIFGIKYGILFATFLLTLVYSLFVTCYGYYSYYLLLKEMEKREVVMSVPGCSLLVIHDNLPLWFVLHCTEDVIILMNFFMQSWYYNFRLIINRTKILGPVDILKRAVRIVSSCVHIYS